MRAILAVGLIVALAVAFAAVVGTRGAADAPAGAAPWRLAQAMSQRRSYVAAAELGGKIYVAGGAVGEAGRFLAIFQRFDPQTNSWTTLERLPQPIRAAAGAGLEGKIYVIGGQTEGGASREVWAYDVARGGWKERSPLPEPRFNISAVAFDGKIYAMGGFSGSTETADVEVYDPQSDTWSRGIPLPAPNHTFGAVVFQGEIWAIGGRRQDRILRDVWIFDPADRLWRRGPSMPKPMELVGAAVVDDQIHAVWESTYQIYDGSTGRWSAGPRPLVTRHGLKAFAVDGSLYTVGGCTTALHDSQVVETRQIAIR
jgi:N-acetylneuraminic acid mutarotase